MMIDVFWNVFLVCATALCALVTIATLCDFIGHVRREGEKREEREATIRRFAKELEGAQDEAKRWRESSTTVSEQKARVVAELEAARKRLSEVDIEASRIWDAAVAETRRAQSEAASQPKRKVRKAAVIGGRKGVSSK